MARRHKKSKEEKKAEGLSISECVDAIVSEATALTYGRTTSIRQLKAHVFAKEAAEVEAKGIAIRSEVERATPAEASDKEAIV